MSHGRISHSGGGDKWGPYHAEEEPWTGLRSSCWLDTTGRGTRGHREESGGLFGNDVQLSMRHESNLSHIPSRLKVTSANILQLQVEPSDEGQALTVKIPLDMVAGLNT